MKRGHLLKIALACGMTLSYSAPADPMPEYSMKAAFLYNFALFTEWPQLPEDSLNLCVLGKDPLGTALDAVEGKQINGLRLTVSRIKIGSVRNCQILFLGEAEGVNIRRLLVDLEEVPVLTVTDNESLLQAGVMIGLTVENKRLTFDINAEAAQRAHLSISSKLLRLARNVY